MNYSKIRAEIEKELEEQREQDSINSYNNVMAELGVEVK